MSAVKYFTFLIHRTDLSDADVAAQILKIAQRDFGCQRDNLSGAKVQAWIKHREQKTPRWAILAGFVLAVEHGYHPQTKDDWPAFVRSWMAVFNPGSTREATEQITEKLGAVNVDKQALSDSLKLGFKQK